MQVHLIDGTYELFRAWFGAPPAQTTDGREVGATRSILRSMAAMVRTKTITHGAVAFDHVIESFRNDLFDGYKTGEGLDPRLVAQFSLAERAADAVGLVAWPMIEFEADDAIATGAASLADDPQVDRIVITAVDKDMCQCVRGTRVVCWDRFKDVYIDEPGVLAKHGVAPESIPDLLALVGDTADGIPGIAGWGKVSAAKVLSQWKHIDAIPDDAARWGVSIRGADALAASLRANRETLRLYRVLATLRTDCPIATDVETVRWRGADRDKLDAFCREIELDPSIVKTEP